MKWCGVSPVPVLSLGSLPEDINIVKKKSKYEKALIEVEQITVVDGVSILVTNLKWKKE